MDKRFDQMKKAELVQWLKDHDAYTGHSRDSMPGLVEHAAAVFAAEKVAAAPVAETDSVKRYAEAKKEHAALKAWRAAGGKPADKPATPNLDALEADSNGGKKSGAKKSKGSRVHIEDAELDKIMADYIKRNPTTSMSGTLAGLRAEGHKVQGHRTRDSFRRVVKANPKLSQRPTAGKAPAASKAS